MKRITWRKGLLSLLAALCLVLAAASAGAEGCVVNLIDDPDAAYELDPDAELLEIVFPAIHGSDACILRMGDETMMIDCSTDDQSPLLVVPALRAMGVTHIDTAFNSHPHDDHITGFEFLEGTATIGRLLVAFPEDYNYIIKRTVRVLSAQGVPVEHVEDGDVLHLGQAELTVFQRKGGDFTGNDLSACILLRYGERTYITLGDVENRGQAALVSNPPACGMKADIMKYPHHGHVKLNQAFYDLIDPELAIITAHQWPAKEGFAFMERQGVPALSTWYGMIRLRTDGHIWVVDYLPENGEEAP